MGNEGVTPLTEMEYVDEIGVITTIMWQLRNASQILVSFAALDSENLMAHLKKEIIFTYSD